LTTSRYSNSKRKNKEKEEKGKKKRKKEREEAKRILQIVFVNSPWVICCCISEEKIKIHLQRKRRKGNKGKGARKPCTRGKAVGRGKPKSRGHEEGAEGQGKKPPPRREEKKQGQRGKGAE